MLIFEQSQPPRQAHAQGPGPIQSPYKLPKAYQRTSPPKLPSCSELQVVRHYTRLSQKNFSIDTQFYPLGSCTMKYNPKFTEVIANMPGFRDLHPMTAQFNYAEGLAQGSRANCAEGTCQPDVCQRSQLVYF